MKQTSQTKRLHALDGLRGIAILMVFFSHINATFISRGGLWGATLFNSGILGVSFLFILSGFLMAYLYPQPKSPVAFLQKRYTRIFPLFLTMCSSIAFLALLPGQKWYVAFGIVVLFALIAHTLWVYLIKRFLSTKQKTILFLLFLLFQICVSVYYLWVMKHPA